MRELEGDEAAAQLRWLSDGSWPAAAWALAAAAAIVGFGLTFKNQ